MSKDPYRTPVDFMTDPVHWSRWKFIIISGAWGLLGIVLTTFAFLFSEPDVPDPCEDKLYTMAYLKSDLEKVDASK